MKEQERERTAIQWYPGHMTRARRMIGENMGLVDAVCEVLDARIPDSSRNPDIDALAGDKPRLVILNRADLADPDVTARWRRYFTARGLASLETDAKSGRGVKQLPKALRELLSERLQRLAEKGQAGKMLRVMILGIPNVGKSTLINAAAGRRAAQAGDKPGVTRGRQWISLPGGIELLDTPGILWPKFESREVGEALALTNAIKAEVFDREALAASFMLRLRETRPEAIEARYKFTPAPEKNGYELLEDAARRRGFLSSGGEPDIGRMAETLLREYHGGLLGRLSLEAPPEEA
ncbi:MAG: ribosome biogenesis GTPase YlqF [Oscillospiraceae bacterium]|nr:ribosome biogenesis GTPase YlqF [Oscillospiraceae bacterium]